MYVEREDNLKESITYVIDTLTSRSMVRTLICLMYCMYVIIYTCMYVYMYVNHFDTQCMYACICMYVIMYTCMYKYACMSIIFI